MQPSSPRTSLRRTLLVLASGAATLSMVTACSNSDPNTITIGYQPGLLYAPIVVASHQDCLAEAMPDRTVEVVQLNSGSSLRDAHLSGDIQLGVYGLGAFLVGWDQGVEWSALEAVADTELRLMTTDPALESLADIRDAGGRIAVPSLDSPQAALVKYAAEKQLGDQGAFDTAFSVMGHPDAVQALSTGQIDAHVSTPPFTYMEEEFGAREITNSTAILGSESTTVLLAAQDKWIDENSDSVNAISVCMDEARAAIQENPAQVAEWLSQDSGGAQSPQDVAEQLAVGDVLYTSELKGVIEFAEVMTQVGMIESAPASLDEVATENAPRG